MLVSLLAVATGLILLLWSATRFVSAASATASLLGMPPLLIGMVVIGFGTSAPELTVSSLAAASGNPGIALGNAYGSNIVNIALILGLTALLRPITVHSRILRSELPVLIGVTAIAAFQLVDGTVSRLDATVLTLLFALLVGWSIVTARRRPDDALESDVEMALEHGRVGHATRNAVWLAISLLLLVAASRLLVWGAVEIAIRLEVSDLVIGLTIVAVGTSLPELASSLVAARRGEHELAFGNILGSNLFNTLAVVGLAGLIAPLPAPDGLLTRDIPVLMVLTILLLVFGRGIRGPGRINRIEGAVLVVVFALYTAWLLAGR